MSAPEMGEDDGREAGTGQFELKSPRFHSPIPNCAIRRTSPPNSAACSA
jgi:hypothetical protein